PLAEQVAYDTNSGLTAFSVSVNGLISYRTGAAPNQPVRIVLLDRTGKDIRQIGETGAYRGLELSPDGKQLAVHRHDGAGGDIWIFDDLESAAQPRRLTFDPAKDNSSPSWSHDGSTMIFTTRENARGALLQKASDGTGSTDLL